MIGWVLFRADGFTHALGMLKVMAGLGGRASGYPIQWFLIPDLLLALAAGMIFSAPVAPALLRKIEQIMQDTGESRKQAYSILFSGARIAGACAATILCAAALASGTHNPFIYFRF
jgi:alginate O-acetyltransferase complex protein AlgI